MNAQIQLARLALSGLSQRDRAVLLAELAGKQDEPPADRILKIREAAARLACTPRTVFNLIQQGQLARIRLPGRKRGCGVRASEITALINGGQP